MYKLKICHIHKKILVQKLILYETCKTIKGKFLQFKKRKKMFKRWWHLLTKSVAQSHKATVPRKLLSNISQPSVTFNKAANHTKAHNGPLFSFKKFNLIFKNKNKFLIANSKNCTKIDRKVIFFIFSLSKKCFSTCDISGWNIKTQSHKPTEKILSDYSHPALLQKTIDIPRSKSHVKVDVIIKPN